MSDANRLRELAVSETGFVFDPYSGASFSVNAAGLAVVRALREGADLAAVRHMLAAEFEIAGADVERDIVEFVHLLRREGLVSKDFALG